MSPVQIAAVVMAIVGASLWCFAQGLRRAPRSLAAGRRRMYGLGSAGGSASSDPLWVAGIGARPVSWVRSTFGEGLALIDMTPVDVVTRAATASLVMFLALAAGVATLVAVGLLPVSLWWFGGVVLTAAMAGWIAVRDVRSKIERQRVAVRRAANDFVQLVAVGLTTDQSVEEAIRFALDVGGGPGFDVIRRVVVSAPQRGVPTWDAIDSVGRDYAVRELCEFATSVERQGLQGVSIGKTVASMAEAMRAKSLDTLEREADKANANLSGPTIGFVVTTIVFLAYPLAQRISAAFGG